MLDILKKITFIGGGSAYIPLIIDEFANDKRFSCLEEIVFVAPSRTKVEVVSFFCKALLEVKGKYPRIIISEKVDGAISGSDLIFGIFRSGGLEARHKDETLGNDLGILGQESQGFGGFSSALRNLAVLKEIAPIIKETCPNALYINITNPSGIMTSAACRLGLNAIGICDVPYAMKTKIVKFLQMEENKVEMDYVGLNHLGWITELRYGGKSILDEVLNSPKAQAMLKEIKQRNIPDIEMDLDFLKSIHAIPSSYLYYYYYRDALIRKLVNATKSRAQHVIEDNERLYRKYREMDIGDWPDFFGRERGAYMLGRVVRDFVLDYFGECSGPHVICIPNGNCLSYLSHKAVIETEVVIDNMEVKPIRTNYQPNGHIKALMMAVSEYEAMTVEAGLTGDLDIALQALASHPLVPDIVAARELLDRVLKTFSDLLPQFR